MEYLQIRLLHIVCASLSLAGFLLRSFWMLRESPWLQARATRVLPHINDTLLLGAAIALAWQSNQTPWQTPWLAAKVGGLLAYIALGSIALKRGRTRQRRIAAGLGAIVIFLWIVSVARSRNPLGFLSLLG